MYAIIKTGGKQYKVNEGDVIYVEKLGANEGDTVEFEVEAVSTNDEEKNKDQVKLGLYLVRETGLEPVHQRYTPLKRARLPIPPLPRVPYYYT